MKGQGREFMEKTKYPYLEPSNQVKKLPQPPLEVPLTEGRVVYELPDPKQVHVKNVYLRDAISNRVSVRTYDDESLGLDELSYVLWCTQGVKQVTNRPATLRTVPSAGARHCFETYVLVNRVDNLAPGLYRFLAIDHMLQEVDLSEGVAQKVVAGCFNQRFVMNSAITLILTSVRDRMMWRYGERGYRYMHLDAGHVMQNLYLCAEAIDSGVCAVAAFYDDEINTTLGIDGVEQFTIYVGALGKKR